jgi:hypothetical protein
MRSEPDESDPLEHRRPGASPRAGSRTRWWRLVGFAVLASFAGCWARVYARKIEQAAAWEAVAQLARHFHWTADGRLAIERYQGYNAFFVGGGQWKVRVLDPSVIDEVTARSALEPRPDQPLPKVEREPPSWWNDPTNSLGRYAIGCPIENDCRSLWYDPLHRVAYLEWTGG